MNRQYVKNGPLRTGLLLNSEVSILPESLLSQHLQKYNSAEGCEEWKEGGMKVLKDREW